MVATFSWVEYNNNATDTGVPTNLNLGSTNTRNLAPSTFPITAGTYSFSKWVRGHWTGSFTRVENLQFYASDSGPLVTGETLLTSATSGTYSGTTVFSTPTNSADSQAAHTLVASDPGAANVGFTGSLSASLTGTGSSDFIVVQASITTSASAGSTNTKTFTLEWDET